MDFRFLCLLLSCVAQAIGLQPFRTKDDARSRHTRSTADGGATLQVNFTLQRVFEIGDPPKRVTDEFCSVGMDRADNITLEVFYLVREIPNSAWKHFQTITSELPEGMLLSYSLSLPLGTFGTQLAILQFDHSGGNCSVWGISGDMDVHVEGYLPYTISPQVSCVSSDIYNNGTVTAFIQENVASYRGLITNWLQEQQTTNCETIDGTLDNLISPLPDLPPLKLCDPSDPSPSGPYLDLSFLIHWAYESMCEQMDAFREGIELSLRRHGDLTWRPIAYFVRFAPPPDFKIRGYNVPHVIVNGSDVQHHMKFRLCDEAILQAGVQFRWLQTVRLNINASPRDVWSLDDILVTVGNNNCPIFYENFESGVISSVQWAAQRNGGVGSDEELCNFNRNGLAVWFSDNVRDRRQNRLLTTRPMNEDYIAICDDLDPELIAILELLYQDISAGSVSLRDYVQRKGASVSETQVVSLTSIVLDLLGNTTVQREFSEVFVELAGDLTAAVSSREVREVVSPGSRDGSTLLSNLDKFALSNHNPIHNITTTSLELTVSSGPGEGEEEVMVLNNGSLSLSLPSHLFQSGGVASSFLYHNMSGFLDDTLPSNMDSNTTLLGPVLSSFLYNSSGVPLRFTDIAPPVRITFPYPDSLGLDPICVYWKFGNNEEEGVWDDGGCDTQRSGSIVTCQCDHLTHFALLLSPGIETDKEVALSLQIIGVVGVSISLVALLLTIFTFVAFRSLWSMRNYIHVQLCACLFVAQLLFVAGIEPRGSEASCSAVAVLLHYMFLVCFMWMLMEGVVLYVTLVKVFVNQHLHYIIAFTVASYGIPLLYMVVCIPLGFVLTDSEGDNHYGNDEACWLRYDTHFVWAFIAPVLLIILINIGFFVMATVIICRHQRRRTHQNTLQKVKHWMKASVSLVVVMGITWAMGVLVFTESLLPLAYIFTIFVAFQGVIIFILLVVLSKQVRDTYRKWWTVHVVKSDLVSKYFSQRSTISKTSVTHIQNRPNSSSINNRSESELSNSSNSSLPLRLPKESPNSAPSSIVDPLVLEDIVAPPIN